MLDLCFLNTFQINLYYRWSGIDDGRYPRAYLSHLVASDQKFKDAKERISRTDTLIIDEVLFMVIMVRKFKGAFKYELEK
jgi:hypothetical protein